MLSFVCFGQLHMKLQSSTILLLFSWEVSNPKKDHEMKPCHLFYWWTLADVATRFLFLTLNLPRFGLNWPKPSVRRWHGGWVFSGRVRWMSCRVWWQGQSNCGHDRLNRLGASRMAIQIAGGLFWLFCFLIFFLTTHRTRGELYICLILHIHLANVNLKAISLCYRKRWFERIKLMIPMKWQNVINIKI